jgi:hypothetical protein
VLGPLERANVSHWSTHVRVKVIASLSWNEVPIWGLRPDLYYCLTVAGLLMWCSLSLSLSDERTGLSFARVTVSSNKSVVSMHNLYVIKCMYIQGLCQSRLSTADPALSLDNSCQYI